MRPLEDFSPQSYFDAVSILQGAPASVVPMSVVEMHLYGYLACVLALFRGRALSEWGYAYSVTAEGFPFSVDLDAARRSLTRRGLASEDALGLVRAERPQLAEEAALLSRMRTLGQREELVRAATACALAFPIGAIRYAINQSPGMALPVSLGQRGTLMQADDVALLYEEYRAVRQVLGPDVDDLLSPAVLWLSARILRSNEATLA